MQQAEALEAVGDCFSANFRQFVQLIDEGVRDLVLVHGEVVGRGRLEGVPFSHCWLELNDNIVIDVSNGQSSVVFKHLYYERGRVGDNVFRYAPSEAVQRACATGHYGPWDLVTSTGL